MRAQLTARIFHTGEPEALRQMLPAVTAAVLHDRRLRSHSRGCVVTFGARRAIGEKAFSIWGPRVLNVIARDAIYDNCATGPPECEPEEEPPREGHTPPDPDAVERRGWYAALRHMHASVRERRDSGGRVRVWTDGSSRVCEGRRHAGAGVFYGFAHPANSAFAVDGRQTCARAELVGLSQRAGGGRRRRRDDRDEADADVDVDEGAPELLTFPELPPTRRCRVCGDLSVRCPCGKDMARGRAAALGRLLASGN